MELRQITEQNPWWEDREKINEDEKVKEALSKRQKIVFAFKNENTLIIGPRQVGKTTFLKLFIKNLIDNGEDSKRILYFSCETIKDFNDLVEIVRFSDSLMEGRKYLFFDEITFVNEWQRAVKFVLDSPLIKDKFIFVTGSSSIALKKETFPGRPIKIRSFLPLSFKEFCDIFGSGTLKKELTKTEIKEVEMPELVEGIVAEHLIRKFGKIILLLSKARG
jgi:predicted AAA+ superfamily ATPase